MRRPPDLLNPPSNRIANRTHTTINRRRALAVVAAVPAAAALDTPALASVGEDAELRELWAKYLVQLEALNKAWDVACRLRQASGFDAEFESLRADYDYFQGCGDLHRLLLPNERGGAWRQGGVGLTSFRFLAPKFLPRE
jgi:hypothetical protein